MLRGIVVFLGALSVLGARPARLGPEVALRFIEEERLYGIHEYFCGPPKPGFLRSGDAQREGLYFMFELPKALRNETVAITVAAQAQGELGTRHYRIALPQPWTHRGELSLGLTDWPNRKMPLAWHLSCVDAQDNTLWERFSMGWEGLPKP